MDAFLASARQARSLAAVDFAALHATLGAAHQPAAALLEALIDAFSAADAAPCQCAIMKAIACVLRHVGGRRMLAGATVAPTEEAQRCRLTAENYILLALFFNELSTAGDVQLFTLLAEAVTPFFQQTASFVCGSESNSSISDDDDDDESTVASLRGELQTLRLVVAKRLAAPTADVTTRHSSSNTAMQLGVVDCLRALLLSLLQSASVSMGAATANGGATAELSSQPSENGMQAIRQVVEGILLPLTTAVDALRSSAGGGGGKGSQVAVRGHNTAPVSPLVLTSALRVLEELVWLSSRRAAVNDGCTENSAEAPLVAVVRFAVTRVLHALQQYMVLQQQQSMESVGAGANERGAAAAVDVLRASGPQRALRRFLSVARRHIALLPTMENAVAAALDACGGGIDVEDPFQLVRFQHSGCGAGAGGTADDSTDTAAAAAAVQEWEETASASARLRECEQIMAAPRDDAAVTDAAAGDLGDLDDATQLPGGGASGSGKEALLQSTVGPVSVNALVEMVLLSIRRMDIMTEQGIQALHLQGLERMQYAAAKKAQREEILRQRRIEQQGVEGIPVGRLLEHLKESPAMYARGTQLLDSESGLAVMLRAGFFSLLDAYDTVAEETEVRVREVQALIARALAQLPSSMMDSALDAVCVRLRRDLQQYRNSSSSSNNNDNNARDKAAPSPPPITSAYHLTMQVLFTLFSAQAPVRERGANAFAFMSAITAAPEEEDGASLQLHSHATFTIDTDNPVEWLQSTHDSVGAFGDRKRPREAEAGVHNDGDKNGETSADGASRFFRDDSVQTPCVYSHLLCRVMELLTEAEQPALLLDALLQCPRLTRYVWHYIHKHYCLSAEKARCLLGMWLLKNLAVKRVVYRRYAVNSLLHLAAAWSEYPRRLAVTQLGALLAAGGPDGRRVIDKSAESLLVRYAKRQMAAIPLAKLPSPSSGGGSVVVDVTAAKSEDNTDVATLREREMRKLADALDRHLGPFLMLCARQPKELFPALFSVFKECVERQNEAMIHLLAEHVDVRRMCQRLFRVGTLAFMSNVMPFLRRHSGDATLLVQKILWAISAELRLMGPGTDAAATDLEQTAVALLGHARVMFDGSAIPLLYRAVSSAGATVDDTASLHDVRFIAPFMSLVTAEELRRVYLRAFLHFVQMQLQQQQQAATAAVGANAAGGVAHMRGEELHQFIQDVVREVLVRSSVRISDGASRGLSRVDLLIYLHRAPHESVATDAHAAHSQAASASSGVARAESRGILGDANPSSSPSPAASAAATAAVAAKSQTAEDLPISTLTTKEVIGVLLRLSRTFDDATAELLYGPEEIKSAVRQLMQHSGGAPVPSQLMATLILACGIHAQRPHTDLVRFVHQEVLLPLAKDATWEKDMQLWRGVLFFAEAYYRECSSFLINLPDQVLIDALRARTQLCDYFKEEHGNNASFGHVLGSL